MNRNRHRRGAALLEFAMALPVAILLFAGIVDFSVFFWKQTEMEESARRVTRSILPAGEAYAAAGEDTMKRYVRTLEADLHRDSRFTNVSVSLERQYACPTASGAEEAPALFQRNCPGERIYLRIANTAPVEPILAPLAWMGFPKQTFTRHTLRVR